MKQGCSNVYACFSGYDVLARLHPCVFVNTMNNNNVSSDYGLISSLSNAHCHTDSDVIHSIYMGTLYIVTSCFISMCACSIYDCMHEKFNWYTGYCLLKGKCLLYGLSVNYIHKKSNTNTDK